MGGQAPAASDASIVSFQAVRTQFVHEVVLDGISFEIKRGELVCILGPSGCGKSTTLRILGDLLPGYEGSVALDGQPPPRAWNRLAYVFQSPRLVPWRTALGNVLLGMELRSDGLPRRERLQRAMEGLRMVGLQEDLHKYPAVLSGGERQRVSIARALAVDPEIILMDEPLSALDVNTRQRLRDGILRVWQETGKTILYVTHDLEEALYLADRILLFSSKPTRVLRTYELRSPRPRDVEGDAELLAVQTDIRQLFGNRAELREILGDGV